MNAAGSVVLDAALSALVAANRRQPSDEDDNYYDQYRRHRRRAAAAAAHAESSMVTFLQTMLSLIKRTIYVLVVSTIILSISIVSYSVIYKLSMPTLAIRRPIYFDYNFLSERYLSGSAFGRYIERACNDENKSAPLKCFRTEENNARDTKIAPPTAIIDLQMPHTQWRAYHEEVLPVSPHGLSEHHIIRPERKYFVDVALTLPESDLNRHLGMFMLEVDLLSSDGTLLASSGRPTCLPHESALIGVARKLFLMLPILIGAVAEARTVVLDSFDSFVESTEKPLAAMVVRMVVPSSLGHHQSGGRTTNDANGFGRYTPIQVHSAELRIGKELNSIQRIMKEWFYTCGFICVTILSLVNAVWFLIMRAMLRQKLKQYQSRPFQEDGREEERADYEYEYGSFNDSSLDWDSASSRVRRRGDDSSSASGVAFVQIYESEGEDDSENWDDINNSNVDIRSETNSAAKQRISEPGDDLAHVTDEDAKSGESFDIGDQSSKHRGENCARKEDSQSSCKSNHGVDKKEGADPPMSAKEIPRGKGSPLDKKKDAAAAARSQSEQSSNTTPTSSKRKKKKSGEKMAEKSKANGRTASLCADNRKTEGSEEVRSLADRVMKGELDAYEVFTDLDEPDP